jgi:hypothetical protein
MKQKYVEVPFPKCPRCDGFIPNDKDAGKYAGALSRLDNRTEVCSKCGEIEALEHAVWLFVFNQIIKR